jgi:hypothetical protein
MEERLLLDWIGAEARCTPIRGQHNPFLTRLAHEAKPMLTGAHRATTRAEITLQTSVGSAMPPIAQNDAGGKECAFVHSDLLVMKWRSLRVYTFLGKNQGQSSVAVHNLICLPRSKGFLPSRVNEGLLRPHYSETVSLSG